jgi:DNA-binding NarL/FixJ family response regulator
MLRESAAVRAFGKVPEAGRTGFNDDAAEDPAPGRTRTDGEYVVFIEADREELIEHGAVRAQHPERPVPGVNERARRFDQATQNDREAELTLQDEHRLDQPSELDGVFNTVKRLHVSRVVAIDGSGRPAYEEVALSCPGPSGDVTPRRNHARIDGVMVRIFLLDDHELVRTGLRALVDGEDDMEVVGEAGTAEEGLAQVGALRPDVAILDVRLPDGNGIEVCREIQSNYPGTKCLILTSYSDDEAHFAAIMAGAAGYLLKEIGGRDLIGDVRRVSRGESLLDPRLSQELFDRLREDREGEARLAELTPQERKVLELIAKGRSNRQIADEIFLAEGTIKNYVSRLLSKLGMQRRTEAAVFATRLAERKQPSPEGSKPSS